MKKAVYGSLLALSLAGLTILSAQTLNIVSGWQMLGATDNITDMSAFKGSCVGSIQTYKNSSEGYKSYSPSSGLNQIGSLKKGDGFWLYGTQKCSVNASAPSVATTPIVTNTGENTTTTTNTTSTTSGTTTTTSGTTANTTSGTTNTTTTAIASKAAYTLVAWNDLGMHCVDGNDYSIFSILPPYNNLHAQLISSNGTAKPTLVTTNAVVTFESTADLSGGVNSTVSGKTNFWDYLHSLFPGVTGWVNMIAQKLGLAGFNSPSTAPQTLVYDSAAGYWKAEGIPIMPYDDNGAKNFYPMVKVVAKDASGAVLASTKVVLPVSDEMDCKACHLSNSSADAMPATGWVNDAVVAKDWKRNILKLHDQQQPTAVRNNLSALATKGYNYNAAGLLATADGGTPVLCAACHSSNALPGVGIGLRPLTSVLHSKHATVTDPITKQKLGDEKNRDACYKCHPGSATQCLRGAMGSAKDSNGNMQMQCQDCHGTMAQVGASSRQGWVEQPDCGHCHTSQTTGCQISRSTSAFNGATLRTIVDKTFASSQTATPQLYKQSKGHGGVSCEACHGSTHAEYPSSHAADNAQSIALQGHSGTIGECSTCHTTVPNTLNGGPHGMHTVGQAFVNSHGNSVEKSGAASCTKCHGADYKGTALSQTMTNRSFTTEHGTKTYAAKQTVGCYDCHNGPKP